jgi:hypothetical protein
MKKVITIIAIAMTITSCGTMVDMVSTCPAYASVETVGTGADWTEGMDELNQ